MKSPGLAPLLLVATQFLVPARAAEPAAAPSPQQVRARMLEMFDENKDGRLDEAERAKARKNAEELGFLPEGPLRRQLMQRFDTNGNGTIDDAERAAVREFLRQRFPGAGLTPGEAAPAAPPAPETADPAKLALERTIRAAVATDPVQLKRFDRDGDGQISHAEWAMARREIQDALGDGLVLTAMASEEEEKKMKAVIEEVARRRQEHAGASATPVDEQRRLEVVAREVAKRRQLREEAQALAGIVPMAHRDGADLPAASTDPVAKALAAIQVEIRRRQREREAAEAALRVAAGGDEMRRADTISAELDLDFGARRRPVLAVPQSTANRWEKEMATALDTLAAEIMRLGDAKEPVAKFIDDEIIKRRQKREREAKLMVKDLLEVGMAQRKAYEEAQRRLAEEEKRKAESQPKN
jgi:Ca2+-binding EF-hand superfamily protein